MLITMHGSMRLVTPFRYFYLWDIIFFASKFQRDKGIVMDFLFAFNGGFIYRGANIAKANSVASAGVFHGLLINFINSLML